MKFTLMIGNNTEIIQVFKNLTLLECDKKIEALCENNTVFNVVKIENENQAVMTYPETDENE